MKKKKVAAKIIGILSLLVIFIIAYNKLNVYWITPKGKTVTEEQFVKDIKKIIKQEKLQGTVSIYKENKYDFIEESFPDIELNDNCVAIFIGMGTGLFNDSPVTYNEVRVNVRLLLYVEMHQMPFSTYGTIMSFSRTGQGYSDLDLLSKEFDQFYKDNITPEMSEAEIINTLTEVIIREKNYKRAQGSEAKEVREQMEANN